MRPDLPKLDVIELDGYKLDVQHFLCHEYQDIREAAEELPAIIEWVNAQLQSITEQMLQKKQHIKEVEAAAFFDLSNGKFAEEYESKMTAAALERAVVLVPEVKKVHKDYSILYGWVKRLTNLQYSLQAKLDLTRSSEATRRRLADGETSPNLTEEAES